MVERKLVYVCSPMRGDVKGNIARAREYCDIVIQEGCKPIAPQIMLDGLFDDDNPTERAIALEIGLDLLLRCNELWIFGSRISEGMAEEISVAKRIGLDVRRESSKHSVMHEVKILPKYFKQVKSGAKTFEYRKDDRDYRVGDIIKLREYQSESKTYTGSSLEAEITYILSGEGTSLPEGYVILSIKKLDGGDEG